MRLSRHSLHRFSGLKTILRGGLRYLFGKRGERRLQGLRLFFRLRIMVILYGGRQLSRITRQRDVRVWVDGKEAFRRIEKLLQRARHTIVIQMFIWKDDETGRRMASVVLEAADRGVSVHINKDAVGDLFEPGQDFLGTQHSNAQPWKRFWNHPRIRVVYGTHADHAKVYVIDDQILMLTGMNIADEYRNDWHDYMIELRGSAFVEQFLTRRAEPDGHSDVRLYMNTDEHKSIRPVLLQLLRNAEESVVAEHCYFSDPEIVDEFIAVTKRGVTLTLILPMHADVHHHANMSSVGRLLTECDATFLNVLIYHRQGLHAKILLVDHKTAFVGSANLLRSSLDEMGEVNVLIEGRHRAVWKLRETLSKDILVSRSLSSPPPLLWISRWLAWLGL